jgi:hypothetical protein
MNLRLEVALRMGRIDLKNPGAEKGKWTKIYLC